MTPEELKAWNTGRGIGQALIASYVYDDQEAKDAIFEDFRNASELEQGAALF